MIWYLSHMVTVLCLYLCNILPFPSFHNHKKLYSQLNFDDLISLTFSIQIRKVPKSSIFDHGPHKTNGSKVNRRKSSPKTINHEGDEKVGTKYNRRSKETASLSSRDCCFKRNPSLPEVNRIVDPEIAIPTIGSLKPPHTLEMSEKKRKISAEDELPI